MENIEEILGADLGSLLKEAVKNKYKFNDNKMYPAKVINNDDPDKEGKVQLKVYGIFGDEIPDSDLPWAIPDFGFIGSNLGSFIVPTIGTIVNVYFDNDDIYLPKYTTKVLDKSKLEEMTANYSADYPDTMVFFETDAGDYFKINRNTLDMEFRHASGLLINVDKNGNIEIDNTKTPDGNFNVNLSGSATVTAGKEITLQSGPGQPINMVSGDGTSVLWQPNILPVCLFTGASHGGTGAGITGLKGSA